MKSNCPSKEEILTYYIVNDIPFPDHDELKDNHWDFIQRNLTHTIIEIGDVLIENKDEDLYQTFLYASFNYLLR